MAKKKQTIKRTAAKGKIKSIKRSVKATAKKLSSRALVAVAEGTTSQVTIDVTFISGLGQLTASLFRNGVLINLQSISSSSSIFLSDVQSGDVISINGVCTGNATISISTPTSPSTPGQFTTGPINIGYIVL